MGKKGPAVRFSEGSWRGWPDQGPLLTSVYPSAKCYSPRSFISVGTLPGCTLGAGDAEAGGILAWGGGESLAADTGWECGLMEGVTLGEGMRWRAVRSRPTRQPVQRKIPAVLRKCFLCGSPGRETRQAGRRAVGGKQGPPTCREETSLAQQLGGCAPHTAGGLERTPLRVEAGPVGWGQAMVQISKPSPGASWCPPPCPELPPRGWQMLFHRQRGVGGLRKVLLGGSGGQRGCLQLPPSQAGSQWPPRFLRPPGQGLGVVLLNQGCSLLSSPPNIHTAH